MANEHSNYSTLMQQSLVLAILALAAVPSIPTCAEEHVGSRQRTAFWPWCQLWVCSHPTQTSEHNDDDFNAVLENFFDFRLMPHSHEEICLNHVKSFLFFWCVWGVIIFMGRLFTVEFLSCLLCWLARLCNRKQRSVTVSDKPFRDQGYNFCFHAVGS